MKEVAPKTAAGNSAKTIVNVAWLLLLMDPPDQDPLYFSRSHLLVDLHPTWRRKLQGLKILTSPKNLEKLKDLKNLRKTCVHAHHTICSLEKLTRIGDSSLMVVQVVILG
ncbi:hypothetical protein V6N11_001596 [Hibiscus sabdariffa]|uniref:Uncharacterized protein n=1 Tax=Hibiscus sabdariffa TaxID=183260 RepID=A0ABR2S081_9ROSI